MERFDVSPIKINHLAFKLSKSGEKIAFNNVDGLNTIYYWYASMEKVQITSVHKSNRL